MLLQDILLIVLNLNFKSLKEKKLTNNLSYKNNCSHLNKHY